MGDGSALFFREEGREKEKEKRGAGYSGSHL
jgi:hypothetical protein